MLTVKEVAERLNISPQSVYAMIDASIIPAHRFGLGRGTLRVSEEDLAAYIKRSKEVRITVADQHLKHIKFS